MKTIITTVVLLALSLQSQPALAADNTVLASLNAVEQKLGARIGVAVLDRDGRPVWEHRSGELFPMASTFKVLACAALLAEVDEGREQLDRAVEVVRGDLVDHSPVLADLVGKKVSLADLCKATMTISDNAAANKILEALGGPRAVTAFVRKLGDPVTRLDRNEPTVNEGKPGDPRDTTSPASIASTLQKLIAGDVLSRGSRETLTAWLVGNQTGGPLLRSGLPSTWRIGDRTGSGGFGTRGVVAAIWPPGDQQWFVAVYVTETSATVEERNAAIASIAKALSENIFEKR